MFARRAGTVLFALSILATFTHCSHKERTGDDPDTIFAAAEDDFKEERYLNAIEKYRDLKNRFPYSARALEAELRIGDTYFAQESYLEAESAYEIFKELHPTHPKSDYVQYRIGLSYFYQIPDNSARDLSAAHRAIESFNQLIDHFPTSTYAKEAKDRLVEAKKRLAEHENYVADFYFRKKHYLSASYRYASLLKEYSQLGYDEDALFRLGECYYHIRMFDYAKGTLNKFLQQFPESGYKMTALHFLEEMNKKN